MDSGHKGASGLKGARVWGDAEGLGILRLRTSPMAPGASLRITRAGEERGDEGFLLLGALVLIFLVLLALSVAAPKIARGLQREKEVESARRANQYVRGIRMYYKKFGRYPSSIEQLEKSNNQRFLRKQYVDPLTGKADWRLIHMGENQTKVRGFFGEELQGVQAGLGSAAGMASGFGGTTAGAGAASTTSAFGGAGTGSGVNGSGGTGLGAGGVSAGTAGAAGAGASSGVGGAATTTGTAASQSGGFPAGTGGLIMGVGSSASGEAIVDVNEQGTYETWEFLYDPRIEQLYAKGNLLGGGGGGSSGGNGLGSLSGSQSGGAGATGTGTGTGTGTFGSGTGSGTFGTGTGTSTKPPP